MTAVHVRSEPQHRPQPRPEPRLEGRIYPGAAPYEVSREVIREFADAIGDPNPVYRSRTAAARLDYPDVLAPPTFTAVPLMRLLQPLFADQELGLDLGRVIHTEQRLHLHRTLHPGTHLHGQVEVSRIEPTTSGTRFLLRTEFADGSGAAVSTALTTFLIPEPGPRQPVSASMEDVPRRPEAGAFSASVPLTRLDLVRYAGVSGDCDPVHWSDAAARRRGFMQVSAQGMLSMAKVGRALTDWLADPGRVVEFGVRFRRRLYVPDVPEHVDIAVRGYLTGPGNLVDLDVYSAGERALADATAVVSAPWHGVDGAGVVVG